MKDKIKSRILVNYFFIKLHLYKVLSKVIILLMFSMLKKQKDYIKQKNQPKKFFHDRKRPKNGRVLLTFGLEKHDDYDVQNSHMRGTTSC